ncbi:PREDICTED: protein ABHD8-like [Nicrophorus vespilloides]|uniref:acylglycerol lipase n=1 Tax=Nicrophorus vespilloides TaxID=110193 RepID=A0ABM1NKE2_NICVS|nr:PREDICTED: protein ABHD8-like [Nicrophorus vespilloides]XP_017787293.1 PREDICTED: protein ABHD8-like [Nicrophorus vespilloides]
MSEESCCLPKFLKKLRHSIYPTQPIGVKNSEFLRVNSNNIHILHVKPDKQVVNKNLKHEAAEKRHSTNRNSLTEEYWFTRWNKPLRANPCNCSFRRSQRYSEKFTQVSKITNIETFVERLIQDTVFEAFQEYTISRNKGCDNLAFLRSPDDEGSAVLPTECTTITLRNKKENCSHKNQILVNDKPMIILLHGIGSTADVWWNIMKNLLGKGFEVVAPDMLGHGYSSAPNRRRAYKFKKLLNHVFAVFDHYAQRDETRKFIIIGHSFGCSLATALCRYRPQQIVQLVLISGGGPTALSAPITGSEISVFSWLQLLISPLLFCGIKRSLFYATRGKHFKPCDSDSSIPKYVLDYINIGQSWPEGDAAFHRRILIPTLLVHGLNDTEVTLVQECEMERTIPRAFLELIPTAGHMSLLETPEHLAHMILCFVDWWSR